mmetsp:Transcript_100582/g.199816  ORF Transcript_100582/g.199816 Transcript_100582/m.199816 type:complete len:676 (-) Transcript_100582:93-2120(-)|eukprot:CAMPEP_0172742280 /NCGR_PEP_ID=MMETSP1074-20121228/129103_1 /TAXON_ID=2916 /ORGANISM="Ceratium fusus, Strain PA161109" /LENGTH=675 /DNA_ID=CAMNT_0013572799 /DNA_START=60 /DNA_END=2087 /DNA_ORIENTATION=-
MTAVRWVVCGLVLLGVASAAQTSERPVMKVVRLLKDMETELINDLEDDKKVHEMLDCWCKQNREEKTAAIELGEEKQSQLEAFLGEAAAKMAEIKSKRDATQDEVDKDWAALNEAKALRMKDNKAFHDEEMYLQQTIDAAQQAVVVLSKHHPELAQVKEVAHKLRSANVLSFKKLSKAQLEALRVFLDEPQATGSSFLGIPGMKSYAPQSGQIFGILKQMIADFKDDISGAQQREADAVKEFEALRAAKEKEIKTGKELVIQLDDEFAEFGEKKAQAFKDLEDTKAQLELDRTFLKNLEEKCAQTDAQFEKRVKDRTTEIEAVQDTIKIINSDEAFDNFSKTVNTFVQLSGGAEAKEQQAALRRVSSMLAEVATRIHSPRLSLMATAAQLDAFTQVKAEIDKMVTELGKQQQDEIDHRDWCIKEMNDNKKDTAAAYDKKESLETKIADLTKSIETMTSEIDASTKAIAETQESMKKSSEIREGEDADFQQTVADQRLAQMILKKALARMKEVYLLQRRQQPGAPHIQTSATHTDPGNGPARFDKYEKNAGGARIVSMIEEIIADSVTAENDALAAEDDAQTAYENMMKQSNDMIIAASKKINDLKEARATAKGDLTMAKEDFKQTIVNLGDLNDTMSGLVKACKFILDNFDARQAARAAEVDALKEAKAILSGMK